MWGFGEEVEGGDGFDGVVWQKHGDIAGLGNRITREIDDRGWFDLVEAGDELGCAAGARWVENDGLV